jgi:hypothetical protein
VTGVGVEEADSFAIVLAHLGILLGDVEGEDGLVATRQKKIQPTAER